MADGINYLKAESIWKNGSVLLGNKAERANTVEFLIGSWADSDGLLVVLDADGNLYERYGGRGTLIDFESANSVVPDFYSPILNHSKYGRTPTQSAKLIADVVVHEKQDRTNNDAFWSQCGRQLLEEYIEYGLLFAHIYRRDQMSTGNVSLDFALAHEYLDELMHKLVSRGMDETDRWRPPSERQRPLDFAKRDSQCPLTGDETAFQDVLAYFHGDGTIPFGDTLATYVKNSQSTTTNSILKTARSMGKHIFDFNQRLSDEGDYYEKLIRLNWENFVKGDGNRNIIFIVAGADRGVSSVYAVLALLACATAADEAKSKVTCLIPDISMWNIFSEIVNIKDVFPSVLKLVIGCGDFIRAARRTDMSAIACFDRIVGLTGDNIIWHWSQDEFLKQAFKERSSGISLMYQLADLGGNGLVAVERSGDIGYAYIPDADNTGVSPGVREERVCSGTETCSSLWFYFQTSLDMPNMKDTIADKEQSKVRLNLDLDAAIEESFKVDGESN